MLGPSGFFLPTASADIEHEYNDIELIHKSEEGFNCIYRVCKKGRFFTYKALKEEYRGKPLYEDLLDKDFNIGFSLYHVNLCQYFAKIQHPVIGNCIVMEWIDGITLEELIKQGPIDHELSKKIICEICDGLDYMHRKQIIHRDLKPENILITHNGQNVKIIDFGLSDADSYYTLKSPAGTRIYASPELLSGDSVDLKADLWSLGVIINEISNKYVHVSSRCTSRIIEQRFESATAVKKAILLSNRRSRKRSFIVIAAVITLAAIIAFATIQRNKSHQPVSVQESEIPAQQEITVPETVPGSINDSVENNAVKTPEPTQAKEPIKKTESTPKENINAKEVEELFNIASQSIL